MSWEATSWVVKQDIHPSGKKFVLLMLARFADEDNVAFPGQKRLAKDTGLSERSVWKYLRALEDEGHITRQRRQRQDGSRTSDEFTLNVQLAPDASKEIQTANRVSPTRAGREAILESSEESSVSTPPKTSPPLEIIGQEPTAEQSFEWWWQEYPRKIGKKAARQVFAAVLKRGEATAGQLRQGLSAAAAYWLAEGTETPFIPHPTTWLNQGRWDDDYTVRKRTSDYDLIVAGVSGAGHGDDRTGTIDGDNEAGEPGSPDAQPLGGPGGLRQIRGGIP